MTYKILHLFRIEKFTERYIQFVNKNFVEGHEFWVYGNRDSYICIHFSKYKNVKYIRDIEKVFKSKEIHEFDKIIYHGVFDNNIIDCFFKDRMLLRKLYLYFWGGDKFIHGSAVDRLKKKYVVSNAHAIINIIPEEQKYMRQNYHIKGKMFCASYGCNHLFEDVERIKNEKKGEKEYIAIQIGNSATHTNNHIMIMKILKKYEKENIKIFLPLSYGDKKYADDVIREGKSLFGEKLVPMTEYMEYYDYFKFINQMDIGIFGMNRQQALGNINLMLLFGKKVFLREKTVLEHYYRKTCHCFVDSIEDIEGMDFSEFVSWSNDQINNNFYNITNKNKSDLVIKNWYTIFNDKLYKKHRKGRL